jgi:hypothetical protein
MGAVAVLFNPLIPISIRRADWRILDLVGAIIFGASVAWLHVAERMSRNMESDRTD